ncbi:hypothetical protein LCGC14_1337810 [marine sediment metagenome]|uniref:Uncharacterized protein n=1 Tax=marine sediment metagenome TaxID=412755 RepID=A0A0F9L0X0_9ZZZZ
MVQEYTVYSCDICKNQVQVPLDDYQTMTRPFTQEFEKKIKSLEVGDSGSYGNAETCINCVNDLVSYIENKMMRKDEFRR